MSGKLHVGKPTNSIIDLDISGHVSELRFNNVFENIKEFELPDYQRFDFLNGKFVFNAGLKKEKFSVGGIGSVLRNTREGGWTLWNGRPVLGFGVGKLETDIFDETDLGAKFKTPIGKIGIGVNFIQFEKAWKAFFR